MSNFAALSSELGHGAATSAFAAHLDMDTSQSSSSSSSSSTANSFLFPPHPTAGSGKAIYLCGNSLGLQPKGCREQILTQLDKWAHEGVEGHFTEPTPWLTIDDTVNKSMATLVGALPEEVVLMNSLTCNLHFMMASFFVPTTTRFKILIEKKAFPSDVHAVTSQLLHHGLDPTASLLEIAPREGEVLLRQEDIDAVLEEQGQSISLVLLSGVQYYTGQVFDMKHVTERAHAQGCLVGFDLAHAVGNIELQLHDWGCDFACWCTYKYMNCGPGSIGGCFVHERHCQGGQVEAGGARQRLAGWWGHRLDDRFIMDPQFIACKGANGYRVSNPPVLLIACVRASLDVFEKAGGIKILRARSVVLTGYLEHLLLTEIPAGEVTIFTPSDPAQRGCQLSLSFRQDLDAVFHRLQTAGIVCDVRKPNVMRVAPAPLYNTAQDVLSFVVALKAALTV